MIEPTRVLSVFILTISTSYFIACIVLNNYPSALLTINTLAFMSVLTSQITKQHFLLQKKQLLAMAILILDLLLTVYCLIMFLSLLIYLSEYQLQQIPFDSHLVPFMIISKSMNFNAVAWTNLVFYLSGAFTIGFYSREYYRIFYVYSIVYIYRYLKKRVKNLNQTLLSGLPIVDFISGLSQCCCTLCLQDFNKLEPITKLSCHHYFHRNCIRIWVLKSNKCPLCRGKVINY